MSDAYSGIYYIINKVNGHKYVGSSVDIKRRWKDHKSMLRGGYHPNPYLQAAWNKYGEENFEFKIMAYTDPDKAVVLEDFILQNYFDRFEYNIAESATVPFLGLEHTEEVKRKISKAHSGENGYWFGKHLSEETKEKISKTHSGKRHSEETKQKISKALYGKHLSEETKRKISKTNSGKIFSEEHKQKLSESHSGDKNHKWIDIPEEEIMAMKSLREQGYYYRQIADIFGVSKNTVSRRLNVN